MLFFYLLVNKLMYRYSKLKYYVCLGQMSIKKRREIIRPRDSQKPSPALVMTTRLWYPSRGLDFLCDPQQQSCVPGGGPRPLVFRVTARRGRAFWVSRFSASLLTTRDARRRISGVGWGRRIERKRRNSFNRWPRRPVHPRGIKLYYTHTSNI